MQVQGLYPEFHILFIKPKPTSLLDPQAPSFSHYLKQNKQPLCYSTGRKKSRNVKKCFSI